MFIRVPHDADNCARVWSARFNQFHDQLVVSSGSDTMLALSNIVSLSSDLYGALDDEPQHPHTPTHPHTHANTDAGMGVGGMALEGLYCMGVGMALEGLYCMGVVGPL